MALIVRIGDGIVQNTLMFTVNERDRKTNKLLLKKHWILSVGEPG
jgi:hypothetical protein